MRVLTEAYLRTPVLLGGGSSCRIPTRDGLRAESQSVAQTVQPYTNMVLVYLFVYECVLATTVCIFSTSL